VPWNDWVEVERLAADRKALERLRRHRLEESNAVKRWFSGLLRRLRS